MLGKLGINQFNKLFNFLIHHFVIVAKTPKQTLKKEDKPILTLYFFHHFHCLTFYFSCEEEAMHFLFTSKVTKIPFHNEDFWRSKCLFFKQENSKPKSLEKLKQADHLLFNLYTWKNKYIIVFIRHLHLAERAIRTSDLRKFILATTFIRSHIFCNFYTPFFSWFNENAQIVTYFLTPVLLPFTNRNFCTSRLKTFYQFSSFLLRQDPLVSSLKTTKTQ